MIRAASPATTGDQRRPWFAISADAHALYQWVVDQAGEGAAPKWNFHKYLIGKKGELLETFGSRVSPGAPEIKKSIESELG